MENSEVRTTNDLLSDTEHLQDGSTSPLRTSTSKRQAAGTESGYAGAAGAAGDVRYGCCRRHPRWLQPLNNLAGFVVFVSVANCLQSLANGLLGVVMSTIERHFELSSSASSWIASSYEIGQIPVLVAVALLGTRSELCIKVCFTACMNCPVRAPGRNAPLI